MFRRVTANAMQTIVHEQTCIKLESGQDTMSEMAREIKNKRTGEVSASADELFRFINKVRVSQGFGALRV